MLLVRKIVWISVDSGYFILPQSVFTISPGLSTTGKISMDHGSMSISDIASPSGPIRTPYLSLSAEPIDHAPLSLIEDNLKVLKSTSQPEILERVISGFRNQIRSSLGNEKASNMLPSCLYRLPSGKEEGNFLSVDLGGSTFRVAFVHLTSSEQSIVCQDVYPVSDEVKSMSGELFFAWMAEKVKHAIDTAIDNGVISSDYQRINIGLSWSFPFVQTSDPASGFIASMGKGYNVEEEILGWDLREAFESRLEKLGCRAQVTALVNDGAASMICLAYLKPSTTRMGLILGTGVNAAVMTPFELVENKAKFEGLSYPKSAKECVFNTEASMLGGDGVIPDTVWDTEVDSMNEKPGFQPLETRVSGRYLGEISRLVCRDLHFAGCLRTIVNKKFLSTPYSLDGRLLSDFEACFRASKDGKPNLTAARASFVERFPQHLEISNEDLTQLYSIFCAVSDRSAALTAACLIALASEMLTPQMAENCTISYTGTVIEKYYGFLEKTQSYLNALGASRGIHLELAGSENGSILGPTIAAAMLS